MSYEPKTKATDVDVDVFLAGSHKPADGAALCAMMRKVSGVEPKMWGPNIVGFGLREYELAGGKTGKMLAMGFSPRKPSLVLYIKHAEGWEGRLARLGKHSLGKSCLYINKLADVDTGVLEEMVAAAWTTTARIGD